MTFRPSTAAPILAVLAIALLFALYVGVYFWLGEVATDEHKHFGRVSALGRVYPYQLLRGVYRPVGRIEA